MCSVAIQDLPLDSSLHPHLVLQRFGIRLFIAETRMHLNRAAFVQALKASPTAPSHGTFAAAFMALYESAQEIVQVVKQLVLYSPALAERWWFFWFHAFSAAVCLAAIPIEAPTCGFAVPALSGLSIVCDLSAAARDVSRVKDGLGTLLRLRLRARERLDAGSRRPDDHRRESKDAKDDELHRLLLAERQPRDRMGSASSRGSGVSAAGSGSGSGATSGSGSGVGVGAGTGAGPNDEPAFLIPNPLAPVRPSSDFAFLQRSPVAGTHGLHATSSTVDPFEPSIDAGPTIPLWPNAASVLIDYAGLDPSAAFEMSIQPFLSQLEGHAWGQDL
jgi:hypothetical protein